MISVPVTLDQLISLSLVNLMAKLPWLSAMHCHFLEKTHMAAGFVWVEAAACDGITYYFSHFAASLNNLLVTIRRLVNDILMTVARRKQTAAATAATTSVSAAHAHKITNFNYSAYYESGLKRKPDRRAGSGWSTQGTHTHTHRHVATQWLTHPLDPPLCGAVYAQICSHLIAQVYGNRQIGALIYTAKNKKQMVQCWFFGLCVVGMHGA